MPTAKGKMKWVIPIVVVVAFTALMSLLMFPMLNSSPSNVPYAILSLDEGIDMPSGQVNAGQALVDKVTGADSSQAGDDGESPIAWTVFTSQAAFDEAMDGTEYYGGIVIPSDFTEKQMAAAMSASGAGDAEKPSVQLIADGAKNASLVSSLQTQLTSSLSMAGVEVDVVTAHDVDLGNESAGAMLAQVSVAPVLAVSMTGSMILFSSTRAKKGASRKERAKTYGKQVAYAVLLSFLVACADMFITTVVGGMSLPADRLLPYLWLCSFSLMSLLLGLMNLAFPLGTAAMFVIMGTMSCAYIAPEMLPSLWLDWIYPWSPAHFLVEGVRSVVFLGAPSLNACSAPLARFAVAGIACGLLSLLPAGKTGDAAEGESSPEVASAAA